MLAKLKAMDAVNAPLAIRPGDPSNSMHLVHCLELLHAGRLSDAMGFKEEFDARVGHFTLVPNEDLPPKRRTKMTDRALEKIACKASEVLASMPTRLDEDRAALAGVEAESDAKPGSQQESRQLAALRYRIQVKELLSSWAGDLDCEEVCE